MLYGKQRDIQGIFEYYSEIGKEFSIIFLFLPWHHQTLPDGYDTVIGEGGSSLSGGEKQRISIARAMLKDAPIVILDEATASIDPENEHLIQEAISALTHGKTIITIAHRLATIENADQILVIDGGTVAQRGTHKELLQQEGTYKKFIQIREQAEGWRIQ